MRLGIRVFLMAVVAFAMTRPVVAFEPPLHSAITDEVLTELGFRMFARLEVARANECVDVGPTMGDDEEYCFPNDWALARYDFYKSQLHPEYHFDDEAISEGLRRLERLKDQIIQSVAAGSYVQARKQLGAALHAIQDFYSHTNWVELGQRQPFQAPDGKLRFSEDPNLPINETIRVAHENTVCAEPGSNVPGMNSKDLSPPAGPGGILLTSGYFVSPLRRGGQCSHGLKYAYDGIEKDTPETYHGKMKVNDAGPTYHEIARELAKQHSTQFVQEILAAMEPAKRMSFRTTLVEVLGERPTRIPTAVKRGETWVFRAPALSTGVPSQEVTFSWTGPNNARGSGQPLKATPAGADLPANVSVPRPLGNVKPGALIGMIQPCPGCAPQYFPIGDGAGIMMPASGVLSLLANDSNLQNNAGAFSVEYTLCAKPLWDCSVTAANITASRNLISNGSFEYGSQAGTFVNLPASSRGLEGWLVTGEGIDYVGALWKASHGDRSIDLDGSAPSRLTPPYAIGGIRQTIETTPGANYEVSFDLAGNGFGAPPVKRMRLLAVGKATQSADFEFVTKGNSPTNMGWTRKSWTFTADAASTSIEFRSLHQSPGTGNGAAIDNVAVRLLDPK